MDDTDYHSGNHDNNYFDALDFGDERPDDGYGDLDFADEPGGENREESILEVIDTEERAEPVAAETQAAIENLSRDTDYVEKIADPEAEIAWQLAQVTNPAESVSVTAFMDGRIHNVVLAGAAATMTESQLADELLVIGDLAWQQARSLQYRLLLQSFQAVATVDDEGIGEFLGTVMDLTSPEQAARAQADVFATRCVNDDA